MDNYFCPLIKDLCKNYKCYAWNENDAECEIFACITKYLESANELCKTNEKLDDISESLSKTLEHHRGY
jgi:hypothetical protein